MGEEPKGQRVAANDLRVGDRVLYKGLDGVQESIVVGLVRGQRAQLVGFYPTRLSDVEPKIAITVDRILQVWRQPPPRA
jgi:hypothetical protein